MKYLVPILLMALACLLFSGCQTVPQTKPISQLTEAEQLELYQYGPIDQPNEPSKDWDWAAIWRKTIDISYYMLPGVVEALK